MYVLIRKSDTLNSSYWLLKLAIKIGEIPQAIAQGTKEKFEGFGLKIKY